MPSEVIEELGLVMIVGVAVATTHDVSVTSIVGLRVGVTVEEGLTMASSFSMRHQETFVIDKVLLPHTQAKKQLLYLNATEGNLSSIKVM